MKKSTIYTLSIIAVLLLALGGSYAYFAINQKIGKLSNFVVSFADDVSLSVEGTRPTNVTVSDIAMFGSDIDTVAHSETLNFTINIDDVPESTSTTTCTFDYLWRWDLTKDNYKKPTGATLEYTIEGPFDLQNVPDYDATNFVLGSDSINVSPGATSATKNVQITIKFYNLAEVDQSVHVNKTYQGGVIIDNVICE